MARAWFQPIALGLALLAFSPAPGRCELRALDAAALAQVSAGDGVSILISGTDLDLTIGSLRILDPAPGGGGLELRSIRLDGGPGVPFSIDTDPSHPITLDVATEATTGRSFAAVTFSREEPYSLRAGQFLVAGVDLGSLDLENLWHRNVGIALAGHGDGTTGADAGIAIEASLGEARLTYNTAGEALRFTGVHLAESAAGAPESPASWTFAGPLRIGTLLTNPATLDVSGGTADGSVKPFLFLNLPVSGTVRVENVALGAQSFGPVVLDGLTMHTFRLLLPTPAQ